MSTEQIIKIPHIWACFVSYNDKRNTIYIKISSNQVHLGNAPAGLSVLSKIFVFFLSLSIIGKTEFRYYIILLFWESDARTLADRPNGSARLFVMKMIISSSNKIMFPKNVNIAKKWQTTPSPSNKNHYFFF